MRHHSSNSLWTRTHDSCEEVPRSNMHDFALRDSVAPLNGPLLAVRCCLLLRLPPAAPGCWAGLPPPVSDLTFTLREEDILGRRRLPVRCRGRYLTYSLRYVGHQLLLSSVVGLLAGDDVRRIWFRSATTSAASEYFACYVEQTILSVGNTRVSVVPVSIDALMIASINVSNAK